MEWNKEVTERVRGAMRDRARVMACLCGELEKILPSDKAEAAARKAITSYGCIRAERDGHKITPDEWVDRRCSFLAASKMRPMSREEFSSRPGAAAFRVSKKTTVPDSIP